MKELKISFENLFLNRYELWASKYKEDYDHFTLEFKCIPTSETVQIVVYPGWVIKTEGRFDLVDQVLDLIKSGVFKNDYFEVELRVKL